MNRAYARLLSAIAVAVVVLLALNPVLAQTIYKSVDENGNVVYSDTDPTGDADRVSLQELSVVEPGKLEDAQGLRGNKDIGETRDARGSQEGEAGEAGDVGLRIVSPESEETVRNTGYVLSVRVDAAGDLPEDARLAYIVDGEVRETSRSTRVQLGQIFRGEHRLSVELRGPDGGVLSSAGPVTFHMKQG